MESEYGAKDKASILDNDEDSKVEKKINKGSWCSLFFFLHFSAIFLTSVKTKEIFHST